MTLDQFLADINAATKHKLGLCAELAEAAGIDKDRAEELRAEINRPIGKSLRPRQGEIVL